MTTTAGPASRRSTGSSRGPRMTADERRDAIVAAGDRGVRDRRARRRVDRGDRPARRRLAAVRLPALRDEEGPVPRGRPAAASSGSASPSRTPPPDGRRATRLRLASSARWAVAYKRLLADRTLLLVQLQSYAACCGSRRPDVVREGSARLYRRVREMSGAIAEEIHQFFAEGMLLNLGAAVGLPGKAQDWTLEMTGGGRLTDRDRPAPFFPLST